MLLPNAQCAPPCWWEIIPGQTTVETATTFFTVRGLPWSGYRVTTPLRTLLDVAASPLSQEHLDKAVVQALERGMVRRAALETAPCAPTARQRLAQALASAPRVTEL